MLQRLEIEPPIDESQSRPAPCVFGSVRGAGAARGGSGSFCSRRPEAEVVASGATAGGLPATRAPRVTATTQHYRAPLRTRQLTGVEPSGTFHFHFSSGTEIPYMRAVHVAHDGHGHGALHVISAKPTTTTSSHGTAAALSKRRTWWPVGRPFRESKISLIGALRGLDVLLGGAAV